MQYFSRISPNSLRIPLDFWADIQFTMDYLFMKTKSFLLHLNEDFVGFNLIYWNHICGLYFLEEFSFGKMWKFLEKRPFFQADMAELGKYNMGGYGRFGVYRVKWINKIMQCDLECYVLVGCCRKGAWPKFTQLISPWFHVIQSNVPNISSFWNNCKYQLLSVACVLSLPVWLCAVCARLNHEGYCQWDSPSFLLCYPVKKWKRYLGGDVQFSRHGPDRHVFAILN